MNQSSIPFILASFITLARIMMIYNIKINIGSAMKLDHWFILKEYRDSPGLAARIIRHVVAWSPIFSSSLIADKFEVDYPSLRRGVNADEQIHVHVYIHVHAKRSHCWRWQKVQQALGVDGESPYDI